MAEKVGGGRGGTGTRGGKSGGTQGPRQPAGRKEGRAGAKFSGPSRDFKAPSFKGKGEARPADVNRKGGPSRPASPTKRYEADKPYRSVGRDAPGAPKPRQAHDQADRPTGDFRKTGPSRPAAPSRGYVADRPYDSRPKRKFEPTGSDRPYDTRPKRRPEPVVADRKPVRRDEPQQEDFEDRIMGVLPVLEMFRAGGRAVDVLYVDKEKGGKHFEEMIALARRSKVNLRIVPKEALDDMAGTMRHQGVVAVVAPKEYADADDLVDKALKKDGLPLLVLLDGVEDPQNLGAIIRTAESAGVDGIIIPEHRAARLTATVAKVSAGALEHMPVAKVTNLADFIGRLKAKGFWMLGLEDEEKTDYTGFDMNVPLALVVGGEGKGLRPVVKKSCDALVSIPMMGKVGSLNVNVATGVALYEALRQRRIKSS